MKDLLSEFEIALDTFFINNNYKRCSFRRCSHENVRCDYSVYLTPVQQDKSKGDGNEKHNCPLSDLVSKLIEEAKSWTLKIKDVQIADDYVLIYLDKTEAFFQCFNDVLQLRAKYGTSTLYLGKKCFVTTDLLCDSPSTLTELRIKLLEKILKQVLVRGSATITENVKDDNIYKHIHLSHKSCSKLSESVASESSKLLLVAPVLQDSHISPSDYRKTRKEKLMLKSVANTSCTDNELENLVDGAIIFDLFKSKLSKPVKLVESNDTYKGATFAIYNYARLRLILDTFEEKSASGIYPKLPQLQDLDFSFLLYEDEWRLVFNHILVWPSIVSNVLKSLNENEDCNHDCKIHLLVNFMQALASSVSSYYGRIQILTEPRPQLLPYLFARIYLLKVIVIVMNNCFAVLGIEPLSRM